MDKKEIREFSWPGLFLVTGSCFLAFSILLKFLNGSYPDIFIRVSLVSVALGILSWLGKLIPPADSKDKEKLTP